jgi:hypothetical protein
MKMNGIPFGVEKRTLGFRRRNYAVKERAKAINNKNYNGELQSTE